jgi:hypothetical protein
MRVLEVQKLEGGAYNNISSWTTVTETKNVIIPFKNIYILVYGIVQIQNGTTADKVQVKIDRKEAGIQVDNKNFIITTSISGASNYQSIPIKTLFKLTDKVETQISIAVNIYGSSTAINVQFTKAKIYIILP